MKKHKTTFLPIKLSKTDKDILYFLWKHRISTFRGLKETFYPKLSNDQAYYKLRRLRNCRLATNDYFIGTTHRFWKLGYYGYKYLALQNADIRQYHIQRQYHDLLTMSALLHPLKSELQKNIKVVSQQELKNLSISQLPKQFLKNKDHLCDGLWMIKNGKETLVVALEVEFFARRFDDYKKICAFYAKQIFIKDIVWVVEDISVAQRIQTASTDFWGNTDSRHLFLLKQDIERSPYASEFMNSSTNKKTLAEWLHDLAGVNFEKMKSLRRVRDVCTESAKPNIEDFNFFLDFKYSLENLIALRTLKNQKSA